MSNRYRDNNKSYAFEAVDMRVLEAIRLRLYAPEPMSGDARRDLANTLDAVMHRAVEMETPR
jgi:hypothetical protein